MIGLASPFGAAEVLVLALRSGTPALIKTGAVRIHRLEFLQSLLYDLLLPFLAHLLVLNLRDALLYSVDQGELIVWIREP